jgi:hypothetical protein
MTFNNWTMRGAAVILSTFMLTAGAFAATVVKAVAAPAAFSVEKKSAAHAKPAKRTKAAPVKKNAKPLTSPKPKRK